ARVTNLNNGKSVVVRINDRGPFHSERLIDLSYTAAIKLGIFGHGTGFVEVRAIDPYAALTATAAAAPSKPATPQAVPPTVTATTRDTEPAAGRTARLFLQVGAFTSRRNADQLVARLQKADFTSLRISPATHKNTTVYRVQVGPLASAAAAERMSERLTRFGIELPQVVAD
ncbi:MAG: septal ring lytic transglycosylase RlpA family protein, partial [Gammaproteobacteria bacterium]